MLRVLRLGSLVVCLSLSACGASNRLLRSPIAAEKVWTVTSEPAGAVMHVTITNENLPGSAEFSVTTPYTEGPGGQGLVEYIVTPDGEKHRQIWSVTVTKPGYAKIEKTLFSTEVTELMHFDLVSEDVAHKAPPPPPAPPPVSVRVVAVFDVEDKSGLINQESLDQLSDYLAAKLAESGRFQVVPRSQLRSRLREEKAESYKACYDENCQIELGKAVAAQLVLTTRVLKIGDQCALSANLQDLKAEASIGAASVKTNCGINGLMGAADGVAEKINQSR